MSRATPMEFFLSMLRATLPTIEPIERLALFQQTAIAQLDRIIHRYGGAVLADEVGLGKSFVAAALARRFQDLGYPVDVIAPAALHRQWQETLNAFGVVAAIEHSEALHRSPWLSADASRLIIVDEAHRFRNRNTSGYRCLALRCIGQPILLVTASPFWNRVQDIHALLSLFLPDDALRSHGIVSMELAFESHEYLMIEKVLGEVMVRRGRPVLEGDFAIGSLRNRVIRHPVPGLDLAAPLIRMLQFPLIAQSRGDRPLLTRFLLRRLESSLDAFRDTLRRQRRFYRRAQESIRAGRALNKKDYRELYGDRSEETPFQELLFRDLWLSKPADNRDAAEVWDELARIDRLLAIESGRDDRKLNELIELLLKLNAPSIIFTGAVATALGIHKECVKHFRAAVITSNGVVDARGRKCAPADIFDAFRRHDVDIIVSTDRSSEGLNLQTASHVIHYDIPWSPLRLDQRNGRAHRIGRMDDVTAWYFIPDGLAQSKTMRVVSRKKRARRYVIGEDRTSALRRWSWIEKSFRAPDLDVEGRSLEAGGADDAILLIERIGNGETSRELVLVRGGPVDHSWNSIVSAIPSDRSSRESQPLNGDFEGVVQSLEVRARSLRFVPSCLSGTAPARRLYQRLKQSRLLERELELLLAQRYPAGIELLMNEMSGEYLDASRVGELLSVLRRAPGEIVMGPVRVVAALKFER